MEVLDIVYSSKMVQSHICSLCGDKIEDATGKSEDHDLIVRLVVDGNLTIDFC